MFRGPWFWTALAWVTSHWLLMVTLAGLAVGIYGGVRYFRDRTTRSSRWLVLMTSALSITSACIALASDRLWNDWFEGHSVSANLYAGLLGLPAAFLIVNLAAERAIDWGANSRWSALRRQEALEAVTVGDVTVQLIQKHYALGNAPTFDIPADYWGMEAEEENMGGSDTKSARPLTTVQRRTVFDKLNRVLGSGPNHRSLRESLEHRILPRLEAATEDPELVATIRAALDALLELRTNQGPFDPRITRAMEDLQPRSSNAINLGANKRITPHLPFEKIRVADLAGLHGSKLPAALAANSTYQVSPARNARTLIPIGDAILKSASRTAAALDALVTELEVRFEIQAPPKFPEDSG